MTDDRKLIEDAAKVARETWRDFYASLCNGGTDQAWRVVTTAVIDFWAAHNQPAEHDTATCLRNARDYLDANCASGSTGRITAAWLGDQITRLAADSQQRERDVRIGRAVQDWCHEHDPQYTRPDAAELGAFIREAWEAES